MGLLNREIIGYTAGSRKDASLVYQAFSSCKYPLNKISIFHTDRGNEFKNKLIEDVLRTFGITSSLSKKDCPYDNAVAESLYHIIKTEFVRKRKFKSIKALEI
jgi:transposase InsO family protein